MYRRKIQPYSVEFSRHLRDLMAERGLTVEGVAARMGRSPTYVSEHTNGTRAPETDLLDVIAAMAHLSTHALIIEVTNRMALPPRRPEDGSAK